MEGPQAADAAAARPATLEFAFEVARRELLAQLGVEVDAQGALSIQALVSNDNIDNIDQLILAARVHCLSKVRGAAGPSPRPPAAARLQPELPPALCRRAQDELYFLQDYLELQQPLNHRNEAAAVSLLLQRLPGGDGAAVAALRAALSQHCQALWPEFASGDLTLCGRQPPLATPAPPGSPGAAFLEWARARGVRAAIEVATFDGLRGCAATRDVTAGDTLLSIPQEALIYDDTVRQTDLVRCKHTPPRTRARAKPARWLAFRTVRCALRAAHCACSCS